MSKCIICNVRPSNGNGFCTNCAAKIEADKRRSRRPEPVKFLAYRGNVIGLYLTPRGTLKPELLKRSCVGLPKAKTINLDVYCPGFTREQVKRMKRAFRELLPS